MNRIALIVLLSLPGLVRAERGSLSAEVGGGLTLSSMPAPGVRAAPELWGFDASVELAVRYGLFHWLEVGARAFFAPPSTWYHHGAVVEQGGESYRGTLVHESFGLGAAAGLRLVLGHEWRPYLQLDVGWAHRSFDEVRLLGDSPSGAVQDLGLGLGSSSRDDALLSLGVGLQWTGDHFFVSVSPRFDCIAGSAPAFAFTLPVALGWSFYP